MYWKGESSGVENSCFMFQFSEINFRNIYQRRGNSGAAISHFMMDILCFCHIGFTFLLTLTANRSVPGLKMKTVISDVSNLPQWFSDNHNSTSGSLHRVVKWSQNYCWQTFALKAYRWIRKIRHFLAGNNYSLNPYRRPSLTSRTHLNHHVTNLHKNVKIFVGEYTKGLEPF